MPSALFTKLVRDFSYRATPRSREWIQIATTNCYSWGRARCRCLVGGHAKTNLAAAMYASCLWVCVCSTSTWFVCICRVSHGEHKPERLKNAEVKKGGLCFVVLYCVCVYLASVWLLALKYSLVFLVLMMPFTINIAIICIQGNRSTEQFTETAQRLLLLMPTCYCLE